MHFFPSHNALTPSMSRILLFVFFFTFHDVPTPSISHVTQTHDPYSCNSHLAITLSSILRYVKQRYKFWFQTVENHKGCSAWCFMPGKNYQDTTMFSLYIKIKFTCVHNPHTLANTKFIFQEIHDTFVSLPLYLCCHVHNMNFVGPIKLMQCPVLVI